MSPPVQQPQQQQQQSASFGVSESMFYVPYFAIEISSNV
jgi:hypothetical protein